MLKKRTYLLVLLAVLLILGGGGYYLYTGGLANLRFRSLLSDLSSEDSISSTDQLREAAPSTGEEEQLPTSLIYVEGVYEITAVSTGEISHKQLKNSYTGSPLAEATTLKLVTRDTNGAVRIIEVILQISPSSDPQKNISYWLPLIAAGTRGADLTIAENEVLSDEGLKEIFAKGSVWLVTPFVNYNIHDVRFAQENQEYVFYARQYYGDSPSNLEDFLKSGLTQMYSRPFMLIGMNWLK